MKLTRVVLTGGPCAGKTEVLEGLKQRNPKIEIVTEVATEILSIPYEDGGVGVPGKDLDWTPEWQKSFQEAVLHRQIEKEYEVAKNAAEAGKEEITLLCDRGVLDGAAYLPGGREQLAQEFGISIEKTLAHYHKIIHLISLATEDPEKYEEMKTSNPCRFEDTARVQELDQNIAEAWKGHPDLTLVPSFESIEDKIEACQRLLETNPETTRELEREEEPLTEGEMTKLFKEAFNK